ncbi:MAG: [protein-PII] uridylyltransferase [Planctomycetaceae bacterium]
MNAPLAAARRPAVEKAAEAVAVLRRRIAGQHAAGAPGLATCGLASDLVDAIVLGVWEAALADLPAADAAAVRGRSAVVAIGGWGRREMFPFSDVDLMFLHGGGRLPAALAAVAARVLQDLFDAGLQVGQSVRGVAEAIRLASADATVSSALLDARPLGGDATLVDRLAGRLRGLVNRGRRRLAAALLAARREEAERFGQAVALLEPNVKRSPGGLRDVQLAHWLGIVLCDAASWDDLARVGGLSRADAAALRDAAEFLAGVRTDLHLAAGRAADDLTREQQARIATARGIGPEGGLLGVERFMRDYLGHTSRVQQAVELLAARLRRPGPARRAAAGLLGHRVDDRFRVGPGDVAALPGCVDEVAGSVAGVVRLVELAGLFDLPIEPATWATVRGGVATLPRAPDAAAAAAFLDLFARPASLPAALRRLHEVGVLEILVPPFAHARHLLQFNNYHKFTVDEHSIRAVEAAVAFAGDDGWLGEAWRELPRRRPLLLALLLHDLGKGFEEDHSAVGARLARETCRRLALPADEAEIVEFLVRHHLAMAHLAFRRDSGDESIVMGFARDVGSPEVLRMLALLTAADVSAVGPGTWTRWKADLLGDLHARTLGHLDGERPSPGADRARRRLETLLEGRDAADPVVRLARRLPAALFRDTPPERLVEELGRLARLPADGVVTAARWQPETGTVAVTVVTREDVCPGIFHRVAGALAAERLEVLAADIHTLDDGLVIDHFTALDPDFAGAPPPERLAEVAAAIRAALKAERPPEFRRRWNPFAPRPAAAADAPPRVSIDTASSAAATIVEVFATDAPGLLHAVAREIFNAGLSVRSARIGTHLDQVVDAFHVTDARGAKPTDPARLAALRTALEAAAAPVTGPG